MKLNPLNLIVGIGLLQIFSGSCFVQGGLVPMGITVMGIGGFITVFGPMVLLLSKIYEEM